MTRVSPIPLARAEYLALYLGLLDDIGAPFGREAARCALPLHLPDNGPCYVAALPAMRCLDAVAHREGIETLGLLAGQRIRVDQLSPAFRRSLAAMPTLYGALQAFCAVANHENTALRFWLEEDADAIRVCNLLGSRAVTTGTEYTEWLANMVVVNIVRLFAGARWMPAEMGFQATRVSQKAVTAALPITRLLNDEVNAFVRVPRHLLAESRPASLLNWLSPHRDLPAGGDEWQPPADLIGSLRLAIRGYLRDRHPDVRLAAQLADTSVRTLQRHLAGLGLNYANLVQQVRIEVATELLGNPDVTVLEVAAIVGYEDPSNFSRAFRQATGLSPREFRRHRVPAGRSPAVG